MTGDRETNFDLYLALMAFISEDSFYMPHLRNGVSFYTVSSEVLTSHSWIRTHNARVIRPYCYKTMVFSRGIPAKNI
jgi:hypothetical protein